jgi:hypothetical protein
MDAMMMAVQISTADQFKALTSSPDKNALTNKRKCNGKTAMGSQTGKVLLEMFNISDSDNACHTH